ncbi:MAG: D-glycero-beta-D-manno-heptose 1-phosphate adenylyltransferase [Nitrospirae bacterium]|nr:D-glycero-beta-D-manno-heptose 1-phosphate adenylyltransferase [Nitrospirota bacterium]
MVKSRSKIKERKQLKNILDRLKRKSKKIVFTNGCFDLIHSGHVRYLEKAKGLGDVLVVAINTDSSIRRIKGVKRPITPQRERAEVLASLGCVDYVTFFKEDTPYELIKLLKPYILVKGGDWEKKDIVGRDVVERNGGKVYTIPFIKGVSTTAIVERILRRCSEN